MVFLLVDTGPEVQDLPKGPGVPGGSCSFGNSKLIYKLQLFLQTFIEGFLLPGEIGIC